MIGIGLPESSHTRRALDGRQSQIGEHPARRRQRIGLQKLVQQRVGNLDVLDSCPSPAFKRLAVAGPSGGVLVDGEYHLAGGRGDCAHGHPSHRSQQHRSSGNHVKYPLLERVWRPLSRLPSAIARLT